MLTIVLNEMRREKNKFFDKTVVIRRVNEFREHRIITKSYAILMTWISILFTNESKQTNANFGSLEKFIYNFDSFAND